MVILCGLSRDSSKLAISVFRQHTCSGITVLRSRQRWLFQHTQLPRLHPAMQIIAGLLHLPDNTAVSRHIVVGRRSALLVALYKIQESHPVSLSLSFLCPQKRKRTAARSAVQSRHVVSARSRCVGRSALECSFNVAVREERRVKLVCERSPSERGKPSEGRVKIQKERESAGARHQKLRSGDFSGEGTFKCVFPYQCFSLLLLAGHRGVPKGSTTCTRTSNGVLWCTCQDANVAEPSGRFLCLACRDGAHLTAVQWLPGTRHHERNAPLRLFCMTVSVLSLDPGCIPT